MKGMNKLGFGWTHACHGERLIYPKSGSIKRVGFKGVSPMGLLSLKWCSIDGSGVNGPG